MITIVDYGVGNLASVQNMLKKVGVPSIVTSREEDIAEAVKLILPGVGAFDACAGQLESSGLKTILTKRVQQDRVPVLGVCVGMQLLAQGSEEGILPGLGWIEGKIVKFRQSDLPAGIKIPHMGWTDVKLAKPSRLFENMEDDPRFYFVHSYHAQLTHDSDVLLYADYGYLFTAALERDNIYGVQFHPEKSHKFGMRLLKNFAQLAS